MNLNSKSKIEDIYSFLNIPIDTPIRFKNTRTGFFSKFIILNSFIKEDINTTSYICNLIDINKPLEKIKTKIQIVLVSYDYDGFIRIKVGYYNNSIFCIHNEFGPACLVFDDKYNSSYYIHNIKYYIHNKKHRFSKPADFFYKKGVVIREYYYINDKLHNSKGPALRIFNNNKWNNSFYIDNKNITCDVFFKRFIKK